MRRSLILGRDPNNFAAVHLHRLLTYHVLAAFISFLEFGNLFEFANED
jgi:hypothetical protein